MNERADATPKASLRGAALGAALIVLLTFAVYSPALRGGFVWDDLVLVAKNPLVTGEAKLHSIWFAGDFPLTTLAFWLQSLAWGNNAAGYHVVNVLLHAMSGILLWHVLARLKIAGAWLASIFFVLHPVGVASVAWISELKNALSLPFCLASLWLFLAAEDRTGNFANSKSRRCYILSLVAFLLALLSKTSTVMLPVILLAYAWWRRGRVTLGDILRTGPYFAMALVFGVLTVWFQTHQAVREEIVQTENFWARLTDAGMAVWFYLGKALLPVNLCMIYPRWTVEAGSLRAFTPLLLLLGIFLACWWYRKSWGGHVLFALGCFVASLFPVLGFFDMYFMVLSRVSDHFAYLALIPIVALVAAGLVALPRNRIRHIASVALVGAMAVLTLQRARVFATNENLWTDTLAKNPAAWNAHNNLGCIRAEQGRMDEALRHFEASLNFNPRNTKALVNLAKARALEKDFAEAEARFQAALKIKPDDADAHAHYGSMLASLGRHDEAASHLREALRLRPEMGTRLELTGVYRAAGKFREAIEQCHQALVVKPDHPEALSNLAWLLATTSDEKLRDGQEAVRRAERACALTGHNDAQKVAVLAAAYAEAGQFDKAIAMAQKAVELAQAAGNFQFAAMNQQLLQLYASGRPYHEPSPKVRDPLKSLKR